MYTILWNYISDGLHNRFLLLVYEASSQAVVHIFPESGQKSDPAEKRKNAGVSDAA